MKNQAEIIGTAQSQEAMTQTASQFDVRPNLTVSGGETSDTNMIRSATKEEEIADVILEVREFKETPEFVECEMRMSRDNGRVSVVGESKLAKIVVKNGGEPVVIRFSIADPSGREKYHPKGISFKRLNSGQSPYSPGPGLIGRVHFPFDRMRVSEQFLYITSVFVFDSEYAQYKFSVFFQRESDGALGLIDPPIENENQL